jgi:peptidoglycan-associated lipoprotein
MRRQSILASLVLTAFVGVAACGPKPNPQTPITPGPFPGAAAPGSGGAPAPPPEVPPPPPSIPAEPNITTGGDPYAKKTAEEINADSPLRPVYFEYDSDQLSDEARKILEANAGIMKQYRTWTITIEGHCDERGTSEYNLALGDRRALAAKNYLQTLGISADRLKTVSYGKEFPFDPAHNESAWIKNRRAHFMVTATK